MVTTTGAGSTATGAGSTATASSTVASKSSVGSSILLTLGSGSGINVQELATNLTNAEKLPAESVLQRKIDKTEAKISGYGLISSQLDILASAFEKINDANEIYSTAGKSSNDIAVSFLSVTNKAPEGGNDINVYQLAENQRVVSNSYQTTSENVNNSAAFDITLSVGVTRAGTYKHAITTEQLQAPGDDVSAYIEYTTGGHTIRVTQTDIDAAMESLEGEGIYTFGNVTIEGLALAINNNISANADFAGNFSSAEVHLTKGISFVQATAGATVSLDPPIVSDDGSTTYNLGSISQGIISATPEDGLPASYTFTPTSAGSDTLEVSDGTTTISIPSTDFSDRTDYELAITEAELQAALASSGGISIQGSLSTGGTETVTVGLADMQTFGLPIPLGAVTLNDLANAFNANLSTEFEFTAVVDDNKLTFVQKTNGTGSITAATTSAGAIIDTAAVTISSVEQMAEAVQDSSGYDSLNFTVSATATNLVFDYKSDGLASAPAFILNDAAQNASSSTAGVNSVNTATDTIVKIGAGDDTLAGIVAAINKADTGITAALLDVSGIGNDYRIVLSGAEGLDESFSVGTSSSTATTSLGFNQTENVLQAAQDAEIGYEGQLIHRGSNVISDVIDGATFQLNSTTGQVTSVAYTVLSNGSGGGTGDTYLTKYRTETVFDSARLTISRDKSQLKTNLQEIVASYNDLESLIDELNTDEAVEAGLSLAGEGSLLRSVQSIIYKGLTGTSSTASGAVDAVRDLGISVDRNGKLQFNEAKYDTLIATNWDDVVTMLTAGTTNQGLFGLAPKGLGQDVATIINGLSASTVDGDAQNGLIANRTRALTKTEENYQVELTKLEARMAVLYQRYLSQFTAMETLMNSLNNTRDYMKSQIDVITSAYDKN
jgi:flagellar hook-associated protein 2